MTIRLLKIWFETMLSRVYRLTNPGVFQEFQEEVIFLQDKVLVCPTHLSICHADQRYYQGLRPREILKDRLPMALIHEAAGIILSDPQGKWNPGQKAVFIPNQPRCGKKQGKRKIIRRGQDSAAAVQMDSYRKSL